LYFLEKKKKERKLKIEMGNTESSGPQDHDELKLGWCSQSREHKRDLRTFSAVPAGQTGENTTRSGDRDRQEAMERERRQGERKTSFASGQSQILGKHSYYPDTISAAGRTRIAQFVYMLVEPEFLS